MSKDTIKVVADDRERPSGIIDLLAFSEEVKLTVSRLTYGDYIIEDKFVCERKTLQDLAQSIIDQRVFKQVNRLLTTPENKLFIIEGTAKDLKKVHMKREALQGALIYINIICGIPILRSTGPEETVKLLIMTGKQLKNCAEGTVSRGGYRPKGKRKKQLLILQGLPEVGAKRAKILLDHFESVQAVITASQEQLEAVNGIGKSVATAIRHVLS